MRKKHTPIYAVLASLSLLAISPFANACTRVLWETESHGTFVTRTMDWSESTQPYLINHPKNSKYSTHLAHDHFVTSKYDVTGITAYGILTDGVNSQGLSGNVLYDGGMDLALNENSNKETGAITYLRHMLSQHKNVSDVVKAMKESSPIEEVIPGIPVRIALHISFQDPTGDSAIVEWRDGKANIWHGKEYTVLTNQPDYNQHLANVDRVEPTWGEKSQQTGQTILGSGANANPEDRFIHATYFSQHLKEPSSIVNGMLKLDSTVFRIPHDAPNRLINGIMSGYATEYTINRHLQSGETFVRYQWGDSFNQIQYNVKEIQSANKSIKFDITQINLAGNITQKVIMSGN